ncbi:MAG: hypothetical protein MZV70_62530 [Desulfobacterales bacterium]|nr:hypothetical protein [Desulfobacterales bacterium]
MSWVIGVEQVWRWSDGRGGGGGVQWMPVLFSYVAAGGWAGGRRLEQVHWVVQ